MGFVYVISGVCLYYVIVIFVIKWFFVVSVFIFCLILVFMRLGVSLCVVFFVFFSIDFDL